MWYRLCVSSLFVDVWYPKVWTLSLKLNNSVVERAWNKRGCSQCAAMFRWDWDVWFGSFCSLCDDSSRTPSSLLVLIRNSNNHVCWAWEKHCLIGDGRVCLSSLPGCHYYASYFRSKVLFCTQLTDGLLSHLNLRFFRAHHSGAVKLRFLQGHTGTRWTVNWCVLI